MNAPKPKQTLAHENSVYKELKKDSGEHGKLIFLLFGKGKV